MLDERVRLFKMLGDKTRLKIIGMLLEKPMYVELIAERLGLNPSTISFHLKKLEHIKLVRSEKDQYYTIYHIDTEKLNFKLLDEIKTITAVKETEEEREAQYKRKILENFFIDNKLTTIPKQRKKRTLILEKIAEDFDLGKEYKEKEVNEKILQYHDDFCFIRREFIMEKLFVRDKGIYKRIK
jgi:hypothetical protein